VQQIGTGQHLWVVVAQPRLVRQLVQQRQLGLGPVARHDRAARLSAITGDGSIASRTSYRVTIRGQSVPAKSAASSWRRRSRPALRTVRPGRW